MSELTLAQQIGQFAQDSSFERLPDDVIDSVHKRVLDILGIAIAASRLETSRAARQWVADQGGRPQATGIGLPNRIPATLAAFNNGVLAHSLDYDDTHLPSVLHPSACVVPAALAAAQAAGADGRATVAAVAVGLEVCVRLGMAGFDEESGNSVFFEHGQHATSICGAMGGAAAAALLYGLGPEGVTNSLGIAASMASGVIEANRTGGTVKRLHCGWAAHSAVSAAQLAAHGFTGPPTVLEGRFGFFQAWLHGTFNATAITEGLGETWSVPGIFFKPYPANHFTHAGIDAARALRANGLDLDEIEWIQLGVPAANLRTIGEPIDVKRAPETAYMAQFSGPYTVVAGLLGGGGLGVGLDDFTDELARDPLRRRLMALVDVVADEECSAIFPHQFPAVLRVRTRDGRVLEHKVLKTRGGPERPLSSEDLATKFSDNAGRVLPASVVEHVRDTCSRLSSLVDVGELLEPLRYSDPFDPQVHQPIDT